MVFLDFCVYFQYCSYIHGLQRPDNLKLPTKVSVLKLQKYQIGV